MNLDKTIVYGIGDYKFVNFTQIDKTTIENIRIWRNHPEIRKVMYNSDEISIEAHHRFIEGLHERTDRLYWLVYRQDVPFGVISIIDIDLAESSGELGYYMLPCFLNDGLGLEFIYKLVEFLFTKIECRKLYGRTAVSNKNALQINHLLGFKFKLGVKEMNGVKYIEQEYLSSDYYNNRTEIRDSKKILESLKEFKSVYIQYSQYLTNGD